MKRKTLLAAIFVLTSGLVVFSQRGPRGGGPDPATEIQQVLDLSPAQVERLRSLLDTKTKSDQRAEANLQAKIDALVASQEKAPVDSAAVSKATEAMREAERARQAVNDKFRTDFTALLNAEQKKRFDTISGAAAGVDALTRIGAIEPPRGRGGRGGPGGPGGFGGPGPGPGRGAGAGPGFGGRRGGPGAPPPPPPPPPPDSSSPETIALGRRLFFDKHLSSDDKVSCATCHDPAKGFSDGRTVAKGVKDIVGTRNSQTLINVAFSRSYFWDGRALTLEHQVLGPISNPKEHGLTTAELERRTGMKSNDVAVALASYVRTIRSSGSRYDAYRAGQAGALSELEQAGLAVFQGKGRCVGCHGGPNLTDDNFHNTGVSWKDDHLVDEGHFSVSQNPRDHGSFKTPTLRDIALTGPYMHDGSAATLEEAVEFYAQGGHRNPYLDPRVRRLDLSDSEKKALVAFLKSLNGTITEGQ